MQSITDHSSTFLNLSCFEFIFSEGGNDYGDLFLINIALQRAKVLNIVNDDKILILMPKGLNLHEISRAMNTISINILNMIDFIEIENDIHFVEVIGQLFNSKPKYLICLRFNQFFEINSSEAKPINNRVLKNCMYIMELLMKDNEVN